MMIFCINFHTFSHIGKMYGLRPYVLYGRKLHHDIYSILKLQPRYVLYIRYGTQYRSPCSTISFRPLATVAKRESKNSYFYYFPCFFLPLFFFPTILVSTILVLFSHYFLFFFHYNSFHYFCLFLHYFFCFLLCILKTLTNHSKQ